MSIKARYAKAAQDYLHSLPLEHFAEATAQATQRKTTPESLALVRAKRPEIQVFNELLVQYPLPRKRWPGQVVPDNMVVVCNEPITADLSYDLPLEPERPFWVLDYISKLNKRKDYEQSFDKYERELKVPYYLVFYPDNQDLTLFKHNGRKYRSTPPNEEGRYPLPDLDLEMALLDGWVRFWYKGELLPLPADLQRDLNETRRQLQEEKQRAEQEKQRAEQEKQRADEMARSNANLQKQLADLQRDFDRFRAKVKP